MAVQGQDALQFKPIFDHKNKKKITVIFGQTWPSQLYHIRSEKMITMMMGLSETKSDFDRDELDTFVEQTSKLRHRFPYLWMRQ